MMKALELGVAFLLFVSALTYFLTMQGQFLTLEKEGKSAVTEKGVATLAQGQRSHKPVTKARLYFLLTEEGQLGLGNWLREGIYEQREAGVQVYIDGTHFPSVTDYRGKKSLRAALANLGAETYTSVSVVDEEGRLKALYFTGR